MLSEFLRRLTFFLRRDRLSADLADEMRLHAQLREEAMRKSGMNAEDAHFAARRRFGNQPALQQQSRDAWGFGGLDELTQDFRYALRRLAHQPGFTIGVITVLALGVGATTAMFSAVDAALLRPLPFHEPDHLVKLPTIQLPFAAEHQRPGGVREKWRLELPDIRSMPEIFASSAAYASGGLNLADANRPQRLRVGVVTPDFFNTLGVRPLAGRTFTADEGKPDGPVVVVLSHALWRRQYGERAMLGEHIQLGARSYEVVGVMPPRFSFPDESDLWIPLTVPMTWATVEPFRGYVPSHVIARLAAGLSREDANQRLLDRWKQLQSSGSAGQGQQNLDETVADLARTGSLIPLRNDLVGERRTALLVLFGATGFLLLIACANVTNLLLSHAAMRRREIAVREVLGATRGRLVRQLLTESVALSLAGAALGVVLAPVALRLMRAMMPAQLAGVAPATLDLRVLSFATIIALATGIGFGLWPAIRGTRETPAETMKTGGGSGGTPGAGRVGRRVLVAAEVALTTVLLVGAGLMLRSFERVLDLDTGMNASRVGTLELAFTGGTRRAERLDRINQMIARLEATPGVEAVAVINDLPLRGLGGISIGVDIPDVPLPAGSEGRYARWLMATGGYFKTMGIPLLRGRNFAVTDDTLAPKVAIINETMAKQFWPGTDAIGRTFLSGGPGGKPITVVGIVADVRESNLERAVLPQMYFPIDAETPDRMALIARSGIRPPDLLAAMAGAVRAVDSRQAVYNIRMMEDVVGASVAPRRTNTLLISAFAGLALLFAALGVYAVISYGVAQRSRELGIRAALGATPSDLISLVSREMMWVTLAGLVVGLAGAWALTRVMATLVYGVDVHDLTTFLAVPVVLAVAATAATLAPAWRARRVDLMAVLRAE